MNFRSSTQKHPIQTFTQREQWWSHLSEEWKKAFNEAMLNKGPITEMPDQEGFEWILESPNYRFAGPKAFYPNMSFELTDLSGLDMMTRAELISVTFHQIRILDPIGHLTGLTSLFLNDNIIESLDAIRNLYDLKTLVVTGNKIQSLMPLEKIKNLVSLQCGLNQLSSFEGLHAGNTKQLQTFVGLPNKVTQSEIDRLQNDLRIRVISA